jgi:glycosyltransferase involved in cell wall biosynthesis
VTTANVGGRDEFFDPAYVRWVDDDPDAVARAVEELAGLDLDPQTIRTATLAKVQEHRVRLQAWIRQVIQAEGGELGRWAGDWPAGLPNKFREPRPRAADVMAEINREQSTRSTSLGPPPSLQQLPRRRSSRSTTKTGSAERREMGLFSLLHPDPVVLFAPDWEVLNQASALWSVLDAIRDRPSCLAVEPTWTLQSSRGSWMAAGVREIVQRFDQLSVVICCPTAGEVVAARREDLATVHCSGAAFVREDLFPISPSRHPRFDAIYDAQWIDYKRHELAGGIRSLALIAPPPWAPSQSTIGYFQRAHAAVKHAAWISRPWGSTNKRWLSWEEINAAYNQARVGLCLSRVEGTMHASAQYLMAGLPVVTTPNLGGRDEFFDPAYVRWVPDDPRAVASAVDDLAALELDPQTIRRATLAKVEEHRARFHVWIRQAILAEGRELGRWAGRWPAGLPNKLREPLARAADVVAEIDQAQSTARTAGDVPAPRPSKRTHGLSSAGASAERRETGYFSLLHIDPVMLYTWDVELRESEAAVWSVLENLPAGASYLAVGPSYSPHSRSYRKSLAARMHMLSRRFDGLVVVASCSTLSEAAKLQSEGVAALHCSMSALIREDFFSPTPGREATFDAIYDAKWTDGKRHDLAGRIRSLALIAAPPSNPEGTCTSDYFQRAHTAVGHATWIAKPWGSQNRRWISHEEVNAAYNCARVGLALSRYEANMYASIQYLLAGLPVVTTASIGGRDEFFDPAYVRWVPDDPEAVAHAVDELVGLELDPRMIREATLAKVRQHRARLQAWIRDAILSAGGGLGRWGGDWPEELPNKLYEPQARADDVIAEIEQRRSVA